MARAAVFVGNCYIERMKDSETQTYFCDGPLVLSCDYSELITIILFFFFCITVLQSLSKLDVQNALLLFLVH